MPGITDFVKKNAAVGGAIGATLGATEIANSESKLKSIATVLANIVAFKPALAAMFVGMFSAAGKAVQGVVRDTGALQAALEKVGKAARDVGNSYQVAVKKMKERVGLPWAQKEIETTKAMTKAIEGITPALEEASQRFATFGGGLSSLKEKILSSQAGIATMSAGIKLLSLTIATGIPVAKAAGGAYVGGWLMKAGRAMGETAATATRFGTALKVVSKLLYASGWGAFVMGAVDATVAVVNYAKAQEQAANALKQKIESDDAVNRSMSDQISGIETLEDRYTALSAALEIQIQKQQELNDLVKGGGTKEQITAAKNALTAAEYNVGKAGSASVNRGFGPGNAATQRRTQESDQAAAIAMSKASPEARVALLSQARDLARGKSAELAGSAAGMDARAGNRQQQDALIAELTAQKNARTASGRIDEGQDATLSRMIAGRDPMTETQLRDEAERLRGESASEGLKATQAGADMEALKIEVALSEKLAAIQSRLSATKAEGYELTKQESQAKIESLNAEIEAERSGGNSPAKIKNLESAISAQKRLSEIEARNFAIGEAETANAVKNASIKEEGFDAEMQALENSLALIKEKQRLGGSKEAMNALGAAETEVSRAIRERSISGAQSAVGIGLEAGRSKLAVAGDTAGMQRADTFMSFKERFDSLRGQIGGPAAEGIATQQASDAISMRAQQYGGRGFEGAAVSDLARIGGGGGVEGVSDVAIDIAREQKNLLADIKAYMAIIAAAGGRSPGGAGTIKP